MFSKRRKNYRVFVVTALVISICILIIAILWPEAPSNEGENINANAQTNMEENSVTKESTANNETPEEVSNQEETGTSYNDKTYYIVKKYGDVISVFFVTEDGQQVKLEDTEIIYDLLTPEDQSNFERGIVVEEQEKLSSLLQDFEG